MRKLLWIIPLICLIAWLGLAVFCTDSFISFLELTFSPDKHIEQINSRLIQVSLMLCALTAIGAIFSFNLSKYAEDFKGSSWPWKIEVLIILALGAIHFVSYFFMDLRKIYVEDGPLEIMTAILAITSGCILLYSLRFVREKRDRFFVLALGIAFLCFGFEEISWGQRILGFKSPGFFQKYNDLHETTLHNFSTPMLDIITSVFNLLVAFYFRFSAKIGHLFPARLGPLLQHPNHNLLSIVFLILAAQCCINGGELSEEVVSVLMLSSSWRFLVNT